MSAHDRRVILGCVVFLVLFIGALLLVGYDFSEPVLPNDR